MKQVIASTVVLIICILTLISSFLLAENLNHNYWWQVIGMAIVTFAVGQYFLKIIKSYQATKK
ncbi:MULTISPECIES: hypothetical protein [Lactobacillus]|uniref:Uncharacterized protein n=1 Tax=Lactobacillus kullabergensis TaxID=1218493 RepID=A0ABM6W0J2_9LACO|nr:MULTISPECIES: hypothetical protein [Lactobacillus]AWM75420.1 hypothetical protein DKL58_05275 [Lactobacillus kullabergensis]